MQDNQCGNNLKEPHKIPNKTKAAFKEMYTEQGLYAQVFMIHQRESENKM